MKSLLAWLIGTSLALPPPGVTGAVVTSDPGVICRSGFIQRHSCWQELATDVPYCCRDDLPEHWVNDDGSSKFLAQPSPSSTASSRCCHVKPDS